MMEFIRLDHFKASILSGEHIISCLKELGNTWFSSM